MSTQTITTERKEKPTNRIKTVPDGLSYVDPHLVVKGSNQAIESSVCRGRMAT